ncbi:MAG: hypothetical protein OXP36_12880, partial [Gammaproteobacteria bacterium]|nr:hypothetical protein [Gammaproteobacteria bacterium]
PDGGHGDGRRDRAHRDLKRGRSLRPPRCPPVGARLAVFAGDDEALPPDGGYGDDRRDRARRDLSVDALRAACAWVPGFAIVGAG